jgi:hypothetical protein
LVVVGAAMTKENLMTIFNFYITGIQEDAGYISTSLYGTYEEALDTLKEWSTKRPLVAGFIYNTDTRQLSRLAFEDEQRVQP